MTHPAGGSVAAEWAATALLASRARILPPSGAPHSPEPSLAEAFLAAHAARAMPHCTPPATHADGGGVCALLAAYASGDASPPDILAALQQRAGPDGPAPEAVLCTIDGVAAAAQDSAQRWRNGTARALEGVPFGIKDIIDVAGAPVTCGSLHTGDRRPAADATCVARLRAAGAIPLFMLATSEFACGAPRNARYGAVPNPLDRTRWTGGSSTGSGAALAAGLVPLALGTDTGGSIRIPAAFCGITGLKPSRGLVPRTGVATLSWTLDHVGPMARSAADIARVLPVMAGPDGIDPLAAAALPPTPSPTDVKGVRIGVPDGWFIEQCDSAVLEAWRTALAVLERAGAVLCPVRAPENLDLAHEEAWTILYAELASCQEGRDPSLFDPGAADRIARGMLVPATDYLRALRRRPLVQTALLAAMRDVDVMITPGAGAEAARLSDVTVDVDGRVRPMYEITPRNTMIFDYTGFPALMLPSGLGRSGLPVAIQIIAPPFHDGLCLAVGCAYQAATRRHIHGVSVSASGENISENRDET